MNLNNNNNNIINNDQNNSGKKVWYNKVIRNEIFKWNRYLKRVNDWRIYEFRSIESFESQRENYFIKYIIMIDCFKNSTEFVDFLSSLPPNIESVEFKQMSVVGNIYSITIPSTLKTIIFDSGIELSCRYPIGEIEEYSRLSYQLNGLLNLHIGFRSEQIIYHYYLPNTLKHLTLSCIFKESIKSNVLPETLESLIILTEYEYSSLGFPKYLKYFSYGKGYKLLLSVLKEIPSSLETLRLNANIDYGDVNVFINNNLNFIAKLQNLKNLSITNSIYSRLFFGLFIKEEQVFKKLTNFELIRKGFFTISDLDIDAIPNTIRKIKIPNSFFKSKKQRGYPASLTSIETSYSGFRYSFENPSNITSISILMKDEWKFSNFIDLVQFTNLTSLKYQQLETVDIESILPINNLKLTNLELSSCLKVEISKPIQLSKLNGLKSLKLDAVFSTIQYNPTTTLVDNRNNNNSNNSNNSSNYPPSLQLLEIMASSSLVISNQNLPPNVKILFIKGTILPHFIMPLPKSLELILISNQIKIQNRTILKPLINSNIEIQFYYNENDKQYYSNTTYSKLYNKIKNKIIN